MRVATRTISGLHDGATTMDLDELSIRTSAALVERGAQLQPSRRPPARHVHRQGGRQPEHPLVLAVDRRRPRRRADRRRHRRPRRQPLVQAQRCDRHVERLPLRVLRTAHGLRPLPAAPPRAPPRHRDPAVLLHARRLRAVVDGRRGDRVLPPDLLARLPAGDADAVQRRHDPPADVVAATCSTARATRSTPSTTATRTSPGCPSSPAASASPSTGCAAAAR